MAVVYCYYSGVPVDLLPQRQALRFAGCRVAIATEGQAEIVSCFAVSRSKLCFQSAGLMSEKQSNSCDPFYLLL